MNRILLFLCTFIFTYSGYGQVNLTESNLPIIVIDSGAEEITDEGKINASMKVYFNEDGSTNKLSDTPTDYDGNIGIKLRGQSSLFFYDKKGYNVETRDDEGDDLSVNLLGMPKESDWVMHGPFGDKSLMRNALMYTLADSITPYAPRVQFCEAIVNGEYRGVYMFTEQIKRDDSRVDISNLKDDDIEGDELTGGYILKFDKADEDEIGWVSPYSVSATQPTNFVMVEPKVEDLAPEQKTYIQNWMTDFEDLLSGPDYTDELIGYRKSINTESFIDFMLLNEMSRNVDGYRLSTYMYKDKDSKDDELHLGPVWDYNLAFGNANYCDGSNIEGWAYDYNDVCSSDTYQVHFWWKKLLTDPTFEADLKDKWMRLRNGKFSDENVMSIIDFYENQLEVPAQRNFEKFPILGIYVWPNEFIGDTYESEVDYLRQWVLDRMYWMDAAFDIDLDVEESDIEREIQINPNPAMDRITISTDIMIANTPIQIINSNGQVVINDKLSSQAIDITTLPSGNYFIQFLDSKEVVIKRFVKL